MAMICLKTVFMPVELAMSCVGGRLRRNLVWQGSMTPSALSLPYVLMHVKIVEREENMALAYLFVRL